MGLPRHMYAIVGANLSAGRQTQGLAVDQVAQWLGVDTAVVEAVENGRQITTSMELQRLCRLYRLELRSMFERPMLH